MTVIVCDYDIHFDLVIGNTSKWHSSYVTHIKNESHVRLYALQWLLIVGDICCN